MGHSFRHDDEIGKAFFQALVERGKRGAAFGFGTGEDEEVGEVTAIREVLHRAAEAHAIFKNEVGPADERFERAGEFLAAESIGVAQHPRDLGQHDVAEKKGGLGLGEQAEHGALLSVIAARNEPGDDVGIEGDHFARRLMLWRVSPMLLK